MSTNWFDIMEKEDDMGYLLRMNAEEWKDEAKRIMRNWTGDLRACMVRLEKVDNLRREVTPEADVPAPARTEFDVNFAIWRDMLEEPEKYGDDIAEWVNIHDTLMAGPGRWRLGAYWVRFDERRRAPMEDNAATRIQAAVRGHLAREKMPFRDCAMCLSHTTCAHNTEVGAICSGCVEQGPYTEETGPLPDPWNWFRADTW